MGNSRYVNDPTIGRNVYPGRANGDATPKKDQPAVDRSVAQPLPGKELPELKEKVTASPEDKAKALTDHSKSGATYDESDVSENEDAAPQQAKAGADELIAQANIPVESVDDSPSSLDAEVLSSEEMTEILDNAKTTNDLELDAEEDQEEEIPEPLDPNE